MIICVIFGIIFQDKILKWRPLDCGTIAPKRNITASMSLITQVWFVHQPGGALVISIEYFELYMGLLT